MIFILIWLSSGIYLFQLFNYLLFYSLNIKFELKLCSKNGDWGLGIGDWGLGIGDWAQSPIPNPQSPIPMKKFKTKYFND